MSHAFQKILDQKQLHSIQSWHEPALHLLNELMEAAKRNLRKRSYNEANAAIQRDIYREQLQRFQCELIAELHNRTDASQRREAATRLQGWARDLRAAGAATATAAGS